MGGLGSYDSLLDQWPLVHVFKPSYSLYEPLGSYPVVTTGGMLQQASLWPWLAGMVDILAVDDGVGLAEQLVWYGREELMLGFVDETE